MECIICHGDGATIKTKDGYVHEECLEEWAKGKAAESIAAFISYAYHELKELGWSHRDISYLMEAVMGSPEYTPEGARYIIKLPHRLNRIVERLKREYHHETIEELLVALIEDAAEVWLHAILD